MLTPDTLAQLSPLDRYGRLQAEARAHYGTDRHHTAIARDFALARSTVSTWRDRPELIPDAVILCLAAWNEHRAYKQLVADQIKQRAADLAQLAHTSAPQHQTGE